MERPVEEMLCLAFGGLDSYDFHAFEVLPVHGGGAKAEKLESRACRQLSG